MPFRVGRRTDLSLCLSCNTVSTVHAVFFAEGGSLFLRDWQSTNGTFVNGERICEKSEVYIHDLVQFANMPFRLGLQSAERDSRTAVQNEADRALALVQFDKLFSEQTLIPYFQPLVELWSSQTVGYEILSRSRLVGLESPVAMFGAAGQLSREIELSCMMRIEGIRASAIFPEPPHVFINTHPMELAGNRLMEAMRGLRRVTVSQPITLEIHEASVTDVPSMKKLRMELDDLNMRLAFDDFGAGQARLCELAEVQPHYVKFDRQMIQDIHRASPQRQKMLASLVQIVNELGVVPVAEGIECEKEHTVCCELGFVLAQGFHYGRPAPVS
ncbi:MAG: EAL domain-containing protein, partial [Planctomycetes bacterium]|nr:EAL domain-containing protein [Planctomycetota bacterium]